MKSYKELHDAAKKGKALKPLTPTFMKWEKDGQQIIGAFLSKSAIPSRELGKTYNQYVFDTDDGHVKFTLGQVGDSDYGEVFTPGLVYAIEFKGMGKSAAGNEFKLFEVSEIGIGDYDAAEPVKAKETGS